MLYCKNSNYVYNTTYIALVSGEKKKKRLNVKLLFFIAFSPQNLFAQEISKENTCSKIPTQEHTIIKIKLLSNVFESI